MENEDNSEEEYDEERVEEAELEGAVETKAAEEGVAIMKGGAGSEPPKRTRPKVAVSASPAPPAATEPSAVDTVLDAIADAPKSIADAIESVVAPGPAAAAPGPRVVRRRPQLAAPVPVSKPAEEPAIVEEEKEELQEGSCAPATDWP